MAKSNRSVYIFESLTDTGIFTVPNDSLVLIESNWTLYIKVDNGGLAIGSTVQDAINASKLIAPANTWNAATDGPDSGLSAEFWGGYKLLNISTAEPTAGVGVNGDIWFQRDA